MSALQTQMTTDAILGQLPSVRIVNVTPLAFRKQMQVSYVKDGVTFNAFKWYELPPAPRGGWTHCDVAPVMIYIPKFQEDSPLPELEPKWVDPVVRANSLVDDWRPLPHIANFGEGGFFGVAALPAGVTTPSAELLASLIKDTENLAHRFMAHGNDLFRQGKARDIQPRHRLMVKWLLGEGAEQLEWYGLKDFQALKPCPRCSKQMPSASLHCDNCGLNLLDDWYIKYNLDIPADDPKAAEVLGRIRAMSAKPAAPAAEVAAAVPEAPPRPVAPPVILPPNVKR